MFAKKSMNTWNDQVNYDELIIQWSIGFKHMFQIFLFVRYSRTSNYLERIALFDLTHLMCIADPMAIDVGTPMIDSGCSLEKEFTELIHTNPWMVLCQTVNQVDSCHNCVRGPLIWDMKDILWMDDHVLIVTYKSLAMESPKCQDMTWCPRRWLSDQDEIVVLCIKRDLLKEWYVIKSLAKVKDVRLNLN